MGRPVTLTVTEFLIFKCSRPSGVVVIVATREKWMRHIPITFTSTTAQSIVTLSECAKNLFLRYAAFQMIQTLMGVGYRFREASPERVSA